jgi:hypothetical protein
MWVDVPLAHVWRGFQAPYNIQKRGNFPRNRPSISPQNGLLGLFSLNRKLIFRFG